MSWRVGRAELVANLESLTWDTIAVGDTAIAQICPACSALVAPGTGADRPHQAQHIQFHAHTEDE